MGSKFALFKGMLFVIWAVINSSDLKSQITSDNTLNPPEFSKVHGIYNSAFDVTISSELQEATIKYTLDCSDPQTSQTAVSSVSPVTVNINPDESHGMLGKTPGVILRACVVRDSSSSETATNTYLFINKVTELSLDGKKPGQGWPEPTATQQSINYGMDPDVLNDPRYQNLIEHALLSIPTISLVTDLKNLFDPGTGIYMNASMDGREWERPASIELINSDSSEGFQINAGIRIRGGYSRIGSNPKHAFRFFFRNEYGKGKLKFPLFGTEGADEFNKVDLRTSQNYSWSFPGHLGEYNTMNRDVFSRNLQREMGQPYTRSRYYHLYIDGYYWGLFQTQERSEANYAQSYFGGNDEDYDVVKAGDGWPSPVEATDGNLNAYREVWDLCVAGFKNNANYFNLEGLNSDGTKNPANKILVDIDNLIDYMLIIFYTGNFDCPITIWGNNKFPHNFYCIYNRIRNDGFKFFIHDAEHTITTEGEHWETTDGLHINRVNIGSLNNSYKMEVSEFKYFHPQWLHFKLSGNDEYKIRFADHVYKYFFNRGIMTPGEAKKLFLSTASEIDTAIIAESARWGDTYHNPPRTKDDDWQWAVDDIVNNYFPFRTEIVLEQLKAAGLYPGIDPPVFKNNDEAVLSDIIKIEPGYLLTIVKPGVAGGSIYYTINGKDPRTIGGNLAGYAVNAGDSVKITFDSTTVVKARILDGATWSAINEIVLLADNNSGNIKITEIHYHPLDSDTSIDNGDNYEFLELKNTGTSPYDLSGAFFENGITYKFPSTAIINSNEFIVIASNKKDFNYRYGFLPFGEYSGKLDNGGERITLCSAFNDTIFSVVYDDKSPWPESPDGGGFSLVPTEINPAGNLNEPANWRASYHINGSPGHDDLTTSVDGNNTENPVKFLLNQNYPNPFNSSTKISYYLPHESNVTLKVYDILGKEVAAIIQNQKNRAGQHEIVFNTSNLGSGRELPSGVYFYRLQTGGFTKTKKMILIK